ncbi:MAG: cellulose synthase subunit BcsC-related outer membrane protein, partial [Betaproteobacteria bacterium]|nr:cellulose synthase subunit BcsC-related outer membrane protein [Betaproteobacteria bacterium]
DASRRQDTSTLLSFAGTTDPRTGLVWGGVLATGVRAGLSLDNGGTLGFWSSFGVHELTGTNVQSNQRVRAMAGETWRIVNEEDRLFSLGLTAMDWHDTQDSGEFTFGQGGYYSPQTYRSLALPVTWAQRYARWSWAIRASVFTSWSQTDASPYFPTDPQLQASAGNPWYSTSSGPGSGYSFSAASEYQATSRLFVGSRLEIERSPYYAPNTFLLYLRYAVGAAAAQPVALPPNPVLPTSSF